MCIRDSLCGFQFAQFIVHYLLYAVTFFADGIAFTVYVVEKCTGLGRLLSLQFGKELSVKFRLAAYDNAWKIKFVALA